jgi:hypothetical protein
VSALALLFLRARNEEGIILMAKMRVTIPHRLRRRSSRMRRICGRKKIRFIREIRLLKPVLTEEVSGAVVSQVMSHQYSLTKSLWRAKAGLKPEYYALWVLQANQGGLKPSLQAKQTKEG